MTSVKRNLVVFANLRDVRIYFHFTAPHSVSFYSCNKFVYSSLFSSLRVICQLRRHVTLWVIRRISKYINRKKLKSSAPVFMIIFQNILP